jgi:hypothetical protein
LGIFKNLPQHASIHPAFRLTLASFTENYLLGPRFADAHSNQCRASGKVS